MKIYPNEIKDKLEDRINKHTSLAYQTKLEIQKEDTEDTLKLKETLASKFDPSSYGLYPMKSILVSSVWNLNDDVFLGKELFASKDTPRNKPLNVGHSQKEIVGHMTDTYMIDEEGKTLDLTVAKAEESLPSKVHIVANSYIYTHWYEDEQKKKVEKLIEDIKAGKYFVSMECVFSDFDYALKDSKGEVTVVQRNDETSWMTKHLRIYEGSGKVLNYEIGRVPRNFSFNGIGIVENPGNPESIIFAKKEEISIAQNDMGYSLSEDLKNREKLMADELDKAKADLEKKVEGLNASLAEKEKEIESLKKEVETSKTTVKELTDSKVGLEKENTELKGKIAETEKEKVTNARINFVVDKLGLSKEESKDFVENLDGVSDEKFNKVVEGQAAKFVKKSTESTASAVEKVLESAETNKENVSIASVNQVNPETKGVEDLAKFLTKKKEEKK